MKTVFCTLIFLSGLVHLSAAPVLQCDQEVFEFGTIENTVKVNHTFVIKNAGDEPLEITNIRPTCGCTIADTKPRSIAPGATTDIPVTFDPKGRRGRQIKNIVITSNDPKRRTMQLRLDGTTTSVIDVQPVSLSFGVLPEGVLEPGKHSRTITVSTSRDEPFEITRVVASRQLVDTKVKVIEAGKKYEIVVTAKGEAKQGVFRETLNIMTTSKAMPNVTVPVIATVRGLLTVIPNPLQLSSAIKTPQTRYITIRSDAVKDLQIESATCSCSDQADITVQNKGRFGWRVIVRNLKADKSLNGEKIIIRTNVEGKEVVEVPIQVLDPYTSRTRTSAPQARPVARASVPAVPAPSSPSVVSSGIAVPPTPGVPVPAVPVPAVLVPAAPAALK